MSNNNWHTSYTPLYCYRHQWWHSDHLHRRNMNVFSEAGDESVNSCRRRWGQLSITFHVITPSHVITPHPGLGCPYSNSTCRISKMRLMPPVLLPHWQRTQKKMKTAPAGTLLQDCGGGRGDSESGAILVCPSLDVTKHLQSNKIEPALGVGREPASDFQHFQVQFLP